MTHAHPEWKRLFSEAGQLIASGKTSFTYDELKQLGGVDVQTQRGRAQFLRFRKECLTKLCIWLENMRGEGYRVLRPNEHVGSASIRVNRARRMTRTALAIATNTKMEQLTNAEKSSALAAQAAIGTLLLASKVAVKETRRISGAMEHPKLAAVVSVAMV